MNKRFLVPGLVITVCTVAIVVATLASHTGFVVLNPAGSIAASEKRLMLFALSLSLLVVIPVFVMLFGFAWKYRASNTKATYTPDWSTNRVAETVWWGVPLLMVVLLSFVTWTSSHQLDPFRKLVSDKKPLTIQVVALEWKWLFIYPDQHMATVNFMQIPKDTPINFQVTADAPMNSFWIPKLGGQIYAMNGMSTKLHLKATKTGDFRGLSANLSGEGFEGMHFVARSSSQADFDTWVDKVHESSNTLDSDSYHTLSKPTQNVQPIYFASSQDDLYDTILMKYMMPSPNAESSKTNTSKQHDPSMPGMQHMEGNDAE